MDSDTILALMSDYPLLTELEISVLEGIVCVCMKELHIYYYVCIYICICMDLCMCVCVCVLVGRCVSTHTHIEHRTIKSPLQMPNSGKRTTDKVTQCFVITNFHNLEATRKYFYKSAYQLLTTQQSKMRCYVAMSGEIKCN